MSFSRLAAMLPAAGLLSLLVSMSGEAEKPWREPGLYAVRLADGSLVTLWLLTDEIDIATAYGRLKVPVADIRRIDVGLRYPDGAEKRIEVAVSRLGDDDVNVREAAGKELRQLKVLAYPALRRAVRSENPEIKRRATGLVRNLQEELPSEMLELQEYDLIVTSRFSIAGRIEGLALRVRSHVFGERQLRLADTRQVQSLTVESEAVGALPERVRAAVPARGTIRRPDPGTYEVYLADGSLINMRLLVKEIEITTRGGKVKVPINDVRSIDVGFRYPEGVEKRVEAAVTRLGDAHFKVRDAAGKELLGLKELAYPALRRAVLSKDLEIYRRASALVSALENILPRERLERQDHDVIFTSRTAIVGRIEEATLRIHSQVLGEGQLRLAETRSVTAERAVSLSSSFNRTGIYKDGTSFPSGGGLNDYALSANLLGSSVIWNGKRYPIGPAGANNVVSCTGQTIALPPGAHTTLTVLATCINGNKRSKTFTVTYNDGSTQSFTQSFSDWFTPQSYSGESNAVTMSYRDTSSGGKDNRTFYIYGYSFSLNSSKTVRSIKLPDDRNIEILAIRVP
jgi:hypothetical protein